MSGAALALRATGVLRACNSAGVLAAADVHVAQRLGALLGETDERVLLAVALSVRGVRQGSVALRLADVPATVTADDAEDDAPPRALPPWPEPDGWLQAVTRSPLLTGDAAPLHLEDGVLWLDRYWRQEVAVAGDLLRRAADRPAVDPAVLRAVLERLWPGADPDDQRLATAVCVLSRLAVLGGGPGTGKTTTVARLLAALREVSVGASPAAGLGAPPRAAVSAVAVPAAARPPRPPRTALAAPTGRAAARLQEQVSAAAADPDQPLTADDRAYLSGLQSSTLHRLLGVRRGSARFWHDATNRLPHDVVVVDEASMLSLTLFARLLEALRPSTRLVLVGDPDQLASVEAGAVLADLVAPALDGARTPDLAAALAEVVPHDAAEVPAAAESPTARVRDGVVLLRTVRRYDEHGAIADLAAAVRGGDGPRALDVLRAEGGVRFLDVPDGSPVAGAALQVLHDEALDSGARLLAAARAGDAAAALQVLGEHRLLCAHRRGPRGVAHWTRVVERWWLEDLGVVPRRDGRYAGLPLLVTANDHDNRLFNGDTGVVVADGDELVAAFPAQTLPLSRLGDVRPVHAMTVHRSQGSQFDRVTVVLPPASSPLGTRETLYTAVTRASSEVRVVGSAEAVLTAVARPVARATGLQSRLA